MGTLARQSRDKVAADQMIHPSRWTIQALKGIRVALGPYRHSQGFQTLRQIHRRYTKAYVERIAPLLGTTVMLAPTYQCQCRCQHCGSDSLKGDRKPELSTATLQKLIDDISSLGAPHLYFFGGEPLLLPELPNLIAYAKQRRLNVSMDTNGLLLDQRMVKRLKWAGIDRIRVSVDSDCEAVHDRLRGVDGIFQRAIAGIRYCRDHAIDCHMSTYVTPDILQDGGLARVLALAEGLGVRVRIISAIRCGRWEGRQDVVLSLADIECMREYLGLGIAYWENEQTQEKEDSFSCLALKKGLLYVTAYGEVYPCCYLTRNFGNIREDSLRAIVRRMWTSDMFARGRYADCPVNDPGFRETYLTPNGEAPFVRWDPAASYGGSKEIS